MKKTIKKLLTLSLFAAVFVSCKKDEDRITYNGGTQPVLTASSTADLVLTKPNAQQHAVTFSWTNPEYQFTTGISSQDVTYYLQIDEVGKNFSTPNNTGDIVISKELSIDLNDSILNHAIALIGDHGLEVDVPHQLEFRIKATLASGAGIIYSNVISPITVTPYLDVAVPIPPTGELYVTGSGVPSGWTNNPPASQKFTQVSNVEYTILMNLTPGLQIKFLSTLNQWQPQYGQVDQAPVGTLGFNFGPQGDPKEIATPAEAGLYKITVLFVPGKYKLEKQ